MDRSLAAIQSTFTDAEVPSNVRISRYFARHFLLRRLRRLVLGSRLFGREGRFRYRTCGEDRLIRYDSRNLQYRALYDPEYTHGYEIETGLLLNRLCRGSGAFWDIGANWGYFSLLVAGFVDFTGSIVAVEPNPRTFADLSRTVEQAVMRDRIFIRNQGAGESKCEMVVDECDGFNTGLSNLKSTGIGARIPVVPLDMLDGERPIVIKVDSEGMELEVLQGATGTLANAKPSIIFENFLEANPTKTFAPLDFLFLQRYRIFVPVLRFRLQDRVVAVTYGRYQMSWFEHDPEPELALRELKANERFLLGDQLNLLGVHEDNINDLWELGIVSLDSQ